MKVLRTVLEVEEALGGRDKLAELTGRGVTAVLNWRARGYFPAELHHLMLTELRRIGASGEPALWRQDVRHNAEPVNKSTVAMEGRSTKS